MAETKRPLLVGMDNPHSRDPRYALYPLPPNFAGGRLCHDILGLDSKTYLRLFDRRNLCRGKWNLREARGQATEIDSRRGEWSLIVLLGRQVSGAFFANPSPPFTLTSDGKFLHLPHPSGRNRAWNDPNLVEKAREMIRSAGIDLPPPKPRDVPSPRDLKTVDAFSRALRAHKDLPMPQRAVAIDAQMRAEIGDGES